MLERILNKLVAENFLPEDGVKKALEVLKASDVHYTVTYRGILSETNVGFETSSVDISRFTYLEASQDALRLWLQTADTHYTDDAPLTIEFARDLLKVLQMVEERLAARHEPEEQSREKLSTVVLSISELPGIFGESVPDVVESPMPVTQEVNDQARGMPLDRLRRGTWATLNLMAEDLGVTQVTADSGLSADNLTTAGLLTCLEAVSTESLR